MRTWIALATHDNGGERLPTLNLAVNEEETLERVVMFTSGDGDEPMEGDLQAAIEEYALDAEQELLLFPLDAGIRATIERKVTTEVTWNVSVGA